MVADAVRQWDADALETTVVSRGGCAAAMRSLADWAAHPQGAAVASEPIVLAERTAAGVTTPWAATRDRPLHGLRVLDCTRVLAGPVATRFLAGFGAEVLRIDPPDWDEGAVIPEVTLGKSCARLDLRKAEGRERFAALLARASITAISRDVDASGTGAGPPPGVGVPWWDCRPPMVATVPAAPSRAGSRLETRLTDGSSVSKLGEVRTTGASGVGATNSAS